MMTTATHKFQRSYKAVDYAALGMDAMSTLAVDILTE
jgi:hypothetical protein